jgi:hypothetical protein
VSERVITSLYSHDSYETSNEVPERGMTCHRLSYLFHYSHDSYETSNDSLSLVITSLYSNDSYETSNEVS